MSIAAVAAALTVSTAAEPADSFAGKQLRIIIPGGTAGGYALYGQLANEVIAAR